MQLAGAMHGFALLFCWTIFDFTNASANQDDSYMHSSALNRRPTPMQQEPPYESSEFWKQNAQDELAKRVSTMPIEAQAKNVLFYLGDGMSVPTVTAARVFKGQKVDGLPFGEEATLHMDTLTFTGTSKTFCTDAQVADSACSVTAYMCGSKARTGTIGVTPNVEFGDCLAQSDERNHLSSALAWAQAAGKSTGVITTAQITDASPAGTYAHIANRDWESDGEVIDHGGDPAVCPDIANQLITHLPGKEINVIMGGGRRHFMPTEMPDPEWPERMGLRRDGQDLTALWQRDKDELGLNASYITGRDQLLAIDTERTEYLLGLFDYADVAYRDGLVENNDPSLEEMVEVAIRILSKNENGFFLFVEGGKIDHAHHGNMVTRAMWETIEFDKAIEKGDNMTLDEDTLIVVTADHAHVLNFAGYPKRGNPILKYHNVLADDGLPFGTLGYANGPGPAWIDEETGKRHNISKDDPDVPVYRTPVPVPLNSETHGGDDVLIFAKGPYAHFLTGVHQQSYIPHVIGYASCIGNGAKHCD